MGLDLLGGSSTQQSNVVQSQQKKDPSFDQLFGSGQSGQVEFNLL